MGAPNVRELMGVESARRKAETGCMARWLSAKGLTLKGKKKEMQRIDRVNKVMFAVNRRMEKLVDDFLAAAEAENSDPKTAKIWTEKAIKEVIEGMKDLDLEGKDIIAVNQVQSCGSSGSAANGDSN